MPIITVRVRSRKQQINVELNDKDPLTTLKRKYSKLSNVDQSNINFSFMPNSSQKIAPENKSLIELNISHGKMVYLIEKESKESKESKLQDSPLPTQILTPHCDHGTNARCPNCMKEILIRDKSTTKCHHDPSMRCPNCPDVTSTGKDIEWLCNHGPDQICTNCVIYDGKEKVELQMLCLHGANGHCPNCLPDSDNKDAKHMTYHDYVSKEKHLCRHSTSDKSSCIHCLLPDDISYKIKPNCPRHKPYPHGLCNDCKPPECSLKRQPYRYVDYVEFRNVKCINRFVEFYKKNYCIIKRVGILLGVYVPDVLSRTGYRAIVHEIYEPAQEAGFTFDSPTDSQALYIASQLNIYPVGLIFSHEPRNELILSNEIIDMAERQISHFTQYKEKKFVTVIISKETDSEEIIPKAFMISDQGVALVRDNIIYSKNNDSANLNVVTTKNRYIPPVFKNDDKLGSIEVKEFEPEYLLVEINCGQPAVVDEFSLIFIHSDFPIENRAQFGELQDQEKYKMIHKKYREELFWRRYSDFHLLIFLENCIDDDELLTYLIDSVKNRAIHCLEGYSLVLDAYAS